MEGDLEQGRWKNTEAWGGKANHNSSRSPSPY